MLSFEFIITFCVFIQPPVLGILLFVLGRTAISSKFIFSFFKVYKKKLKGVKFFECAVYPRLLNTFQYDIFILSFCLIFILYDLDLIFFFTEATNITNWTIFEFIFILFNFLMFLLGIWVDYIKNGFNWSH